MSCSDFNSAFVANVGTFSSKLVLIMNPEIADLSTKILPFMLSSTIFLANLLQ